MRRDWPRDAGSRAGSSAGILNGIRRDRLPGLPAREQPLFWPCGFPVIAENVQQPGRKHNVTIFSPLARLHTDDHPLAVDSGWLEPDCLGNTQSRRVADRQNQPLLGDFHRAQESGNLRGAQHFGKRVRLPASWDVILDGPFPAKRDGIEEPKRGDRKRDRTGSQALVPRQVDLPGADLGRPEPFRRFAKMPGEPVDLFDVADLSSGGEVADLHILDHPTAKWGHDQLLCEISSATWRRWIVSQLSGQARGAA